MSLFDLSPEAKELYKKLEEFVLKKCQPAEKEYEAHLRTRFGKDRWTSEAVPPCVSRLQEEAKSLGLWNLFIPPHLVKEIPDGAPSPSTLLSYREYGIFCEMMGKSFLAPEACNCHAPDTGNMEVLLHHGTSEQKEKYLIPMLRGIFRSAFLMTEPDVASSDATNIQTTLRRVHNGSRVHYVLNGRKWWSTGAMDPRCKVALVLARMDRAPGQEPRHGAHTVVLVDMSNVTMVRPLSVMGYDDAPHGHAEVALHDVIVHPQDLVLGEGKGFLIAQSRLGPGRIHHCMRSIGMAARAYELMLMRTLQRKTFGQYLFQHGGCQEMIADSASDLEAARLLTLGCAASMDTVGVKNSRDKIASIKVSVPELCYKVVDRAVQVFGGAGVHEDFPLARILVGLRSLRIADGPDAVHRRTVALLEIKKIKQKAKQSSL